MIDFEIVDVDANSALRNGLGGVRFETVLGRDFFLRPLRLIGKKVLFIHSLHLLWTIPPHLLFCLIEYIVLLQGQQLLEYSLFLRVQIQDQFVGFVGRLIGFWRRIWGLGVRFPVLLGFVEGFGEVSVLGDHLLVHFEVIKLVQQDTLLVLIELTSYYLINGHADVLALELRGKRPPLGEHLKDLNHDGRSSSLVLWIQQLENHFFQHQILLVNLCEVLHVLQENLHIQAPVFEVPNVLHAL